MKKRESGSAVKRLFHCFSMCKNVEKENTEEDLDEDYNQVKKEHLPLNGICDNKEVFIIQEKDSESTVKRDNPVI